MGKVLDRNPQTQLNKSRTSFDMGQTFAFTASTGMLLPVYKDLLNVSETVYLDSALVCRTQPIVTASMADVNVYLDWFFVPISMLYTLFPSLRYMTNDLISSNFDPNQVTTGNLPLVNIQASVGVMGFDAQSRDASSEERYSDLGGYPSQFGCACLQTFRLLEHLGFNPQETLHTYDDQDYVYNPNVFPWGALAYQAIYQDYYRDDTFERREVRCFNVDNHYSSNAPFGDSHGIFMLRFRNRYSDYFQNVRPAPYLSAVNLLGRGVDFGAFENLLNYSAFGSKDDIILLNQNASYVEPSSGSLSNDYSSTSAQFINSDYNNSTSSIRASFAVEKLLRVIGRSKKDYDSQILAHFGFKVPHDVKHEITHLFTQKGLLHIGEVVSTANTTDLRDNSNGSALGAIGGKGYVYIPGRKKKFKFTAPVDGVLMCIFSAVPEPIYTRTFDRQNAVTSRYDFYTEELDNLGSQPFYRYEVDTEAFNSEYQNVRFGWQYRYMQWKQKYGRATRAFARSQSTGTVNVQSPWVLGFDFIDRMNRVYWPASGNLDFWNFKASPHDLDGIMEVPYNGRWDDEYLTNYWLIYRSDPFICQFRANVDKVSPMSPYGEPNLNGI